MTTSTSGPTPDPDGYTVTIDAGAPQAVGINGSVSFPNLLAGIHTFQLSGIAANWTVAGDNPRMVDVPAGRTASTTFTVTCAFALRNQIVFATNRDDNLEIYVMSAAGIALTRLTNNAAFDGGPSWAPMGEGSPSSRIGMRTSSST